MKMIPLVPYYALPAHSYAYRTRVLAPVPRLGPAPGGEFFWPTVESWIARGTKSSATVFVPIRGPMTVQRNQNRHSNFLRGAKHQLMLLSAATLVLLFFAWTYLD
jgi:Rieske Fe-S protein